MAMPSIELQALIDDVAYRLSAPAVLEDEEQRLIAHSAQNGPVDEIRRDSILRRYTRPAVRDWFRKFGIVTAKQPLRIPRDPEEGILGRLCVPIDHHGVRVGYLWLIDDGERLDGEAVASAAKAAQAAGLIIFEEILAERLASGVLEHLLSPSEELRTESARHMADSGLLSERGPVVAVVVQPAAATINRSMIVQSLRDVTRRCPPGEVCGLAHTDHGVLVTRCPERDRRAAPRLLAEAVRQAMNRRLSLEGSAETALVAGIGDTRPMLANAFLSYREARLAARIAATIATIGPIAFWQDLGVFRTLAQLPMSEAVTSSLDPRLVCLFQSADPALLATLETFLDLAGDVKATAESLHVHRGTLYYRLQKAEQLAQADLHKGPDRLALHLGFKLARLAGLYSDEEDALHSARRDLGQVVR
jgi:hypothetical protein